MVTDHAKSRQQSQKGLCLLVQTIVLQQGCGFQFDTHETHMRGQSQQLTSVTGSRADTAVPLTCVFLSWIN